MPKWKSCYITYEIAKMASIKCNESQANMSHANSVSEATIRGWLKDKEKFHDFVDTVNSTDGMKRKRPELCQRPTIWYGSFHMVCEGEAGRNHD